MLSLAAILARRRSTPSDGSMLAEFIRSLSWCFRDADARKGRREWQARWSQPDYTAPWMGRPVSKEIVDAVAEGWFPPRARALDVGCGEGEVTAWLAGQGLPSLGVDIAPAAIRRARAAHGDVPEAEFRTLDICSELPPSPAFRVVVDRGCFHSISPSRRASYVRNLAAACIPDARFLLFIKAFRGDRPFPDCDERERHVSALRAAFGDAFSIVRVAETYLDPSEGRDPAQALPGLVVWMIRQPMLTSTTTAK